ncbi:hypothetical protein GCM10010215_77760 [Streptomyces virginiae]|uniref:Uncharacterized protein n=1 Tax=Streptomyces virginiae TaxID=1961 RepID=A0ABQ3NRX5_STRVG|nr:hypothetical protein GCM10010215_77760 [Streptomyces virginiae]GHI15518.1 hypothetical protein Scinn_49810 [Streptomyces virginiae]GLV96356.1 hypothetical protein Slala04_78090 [Streptomyces lavendulae subsp. lavendulae]
MTTTPAPLRPAVTAPIAAATVVAAFYLQPPDPENEPPPWFRATLDIGTRLHGAGQFVLDVGIPDPFPDGQSQDGLKGQILQLPEVPDLRLCTSHTCDERGDSRVCRPRWSPCANCGRVCEEFRRTVVT